MAGPQYAALILQLAAGLIDPTDPDFPFAFNLFAPMPDRVELDRYSTNTDYVKRIMREEYIRPASVTAALIGSATASSPWVRWEVAEGQRQSEGLLGIRLKGTYGAVPRESQPTRLAIGTQENSGSGLSGPTGIAAARNFPPSSRPSSYTCGSRGLKPL